MNLFGLLVLLAALFNLGCAHSSDIRVMHSKAEITVRALDVEDGDMLICDVEGCRKLK